MNAAVVDRKPAPPALQDPSLFRDRCWLDGAWVEAACHVAGMSPTPEDRAVFRAALKGLLASSDLSLNQLGEFCAKISEATNAYGHPIRHALGWALPWVGLPRDTLLFSNARTYGTASTAWRRCAW